MMSLDVSDSTQVYAAFLVYLDLLEGKWGKWLHPNQCLWPLGAVKFVVFTGTGPFLTKSLLPLLRIFVLEVSILCLPGACAMMRACFIQHFQVQVFREKAVSREIEAKEQ